MEDRIQVLILKRCKINQKLLESLSKFQKTITLPFASLLSLPKIKLHCGGQIRN